MERLIIYTWSQNTMRGRGGKYWHIIIHFQEGVACYSITIVQIYNALRRVGPREGVYCQYRTLRCPLLPRVSPHARLTNLVRWAIHLNLSPEHELFQIHNPSLPPTPYLILPWGEAPQHVSCLKVYVTQQPSLRRAVLTMDADDVSVAHEHPGAKLDACSYLF